MSKIRVPKPFSDLVNEFKNKKEPDVDHEFEEKKEQMKDIVIKNQPPQTAPAPTDEN